MVRSSTARAPLAKRMLLAVASLLVTCAAGEVVARVFLREHWHTQALAARLYQVSSKSLTQLHDDPALAFSLRPHLDADFEGSRVLTDSSGVRVGAAKLPEAEVSLRIALLGDSTAFGWRVDYEDSYGEQLRRQLEARSDTPVLVRNYSVMGYNASQQHATFVKTIRAFEPQLLIVHHDHNDAEPTGKGFAGRMLPEYGENPLRSAALKLVLRKLKTIRERIFPTTDDGLVHMLNGYFKSGPYYEAMIEHRRQLIEAARAAGVPVLFLIFNAEVEAEPHYESHPMYIQLHRDFAQQLEHMGALVLDLYPVYHRMLEETRRADLSHLWIDAEDRHPNAEGHAFIADVLAQYIESSPELSPLLLSMR